MSKKMYYTEAEAAEKLGVTIDDLRRFVEQGKLNVYADGPRRMYRAEAVDGFATHISGETGEIELTPADTSAQDAVRLESEAPPPPAAKSDTVLSSEGVSVFDEGDLDVETADPMAKTSIAPSMEAQISLEGVGSGSGLLDLTRESDDTSLGAEVLDHIDMESAVGSSASVEAVGAEPAYVEPEPAVMDQPVLVEAADPSAGAFSGLVIGATVLMLVAGAVAIAGMRGLVPPMLSTLYANLIVVLAGGAAVCILLAVAGYFIGKSAADRAMAMRRSSGS